MFVWFVCLLGNSKNLRSYSRLHAKGSAELLRALQNFLTRQELLLFAKWAPDLRDVNVVAVSLLVTSVSGTCQPGDATGDAWRLV